VAAAVAVVVFGAVLLVAARNDMPLVSLTQDPVGLTELRWQAGLVYKIGLLVWGAIVASCLVGAAVWRRLGGAGCLPAFLLASAILTLVFAIDDMFQLRGEVYDHLRLPELAVFALYALAFCGFAAVFWRTVLRTEYLILAAAVGLLVLWLGLRHAGVELVVQDGVRFVAELVLLLYFLRTAAYGLRAPR
jgi:hypothetical protein